MSQYHFVTRWQVDAPIEDVFDAISESERWPSWWKGVEQVFELERGDDDGIGRRLHLVWKSALPYRLAFDVTVTRVDRPNALEAHATGELEGTGRWDIRESPNGGTDVTYYWDVRTTRRWMNALGPLPGPIFRWNHDYVMRSGGRGLRRLLASSATAGSRPRATPRT
jgi:uncharacterized protein YndB with AHSA1/START domain